jgi:hypothetical protein
MCSLGNYDAKSFSSMQVSMINPLNNTGKWDWQFERVACLLHLKQRTVDLSFRISKNPLISSAGAILVHTDAAKWVRVQ